MLLLSQRVEVLREDFLDFVASLKTVLSHHCIFTVLGRHDAREKLVTTRNIVLFQIKASSVTIGPLG